MTMRPNHAIHFILVGLIFPCAAIIPHAMETAQAQIYPLSENAWDNPSFRKRFLGSYGVATSVEPEVSTTEYELLRNLLPSMQDDPAQAISHLEKHRKEDSSAALDFILGNLYYEQGSFSAAQKQYERAIERFPNFRRAYRNLALVRVQTNAYGSAIPHLVKAIELGASDGTIYGLLGYCYLHEDRQQSALSCYRMAQMFDPDSVDWKLGEAYAHTALHKDLEAVGAYEELIQAHPDNDQLWAGQANAYLALDDLANAATNLEMIRLLQKANAERLLLLGDVYVNMNLTDLGVKRYIAAVQIAEPLAVQDFLERIEILTQREDWTSAHSLLKQCDQSFTPEQMDPHQTDRTTLQAMIALGRGHSEEAAKLLQTVVEQSPLHGQALMLLADYHAQEEQLEKAEIIFERAARLPEYRAEALTRHAQRLVAHGHIAEAIRLLEQAQEVAYRRSVETYLKALERIARQ